MCWREKEEEGAKAYIVTYPCLYSTEATIIKHGRRSLGYGFVAFETAAEAEKARKELNKKELEGREVNVEVAKPKAHVEKKQEQASTSSEDEGEKKPRARKPVSIFSLSLLKRIFLDTLAH